LEFKICYNSISDHAILKRMDKTGIVRRALQLNLKGKELWDDPK
jgi:hypothetical protein